MAFLLRAFSRVDQQKDKQTSADVVNKTFQAELSTVRNKLGGEDDEVQSLVELIYDSSFPESQKFLKNPTKDRLNSHKETLTRLLFGLAAQDVPVTRIICDHVQTHGFDLISDTIITLLELIRPLLASKDLPQFTSDDLLDAIDIQWHSPLRSSRRSQAQSPFQSPRVSVSSPSSRFSVSSPRSPFSINSSGIQASPGQAQPLGLLSPGKAQSWGSYFKYQSDDSSSSFPDSGWDGPIGTPPKRISPLHSATRNLEFSTSLPNGEKLEPLVENEEDLNQGARISHKLEENSADNDSSSKPNSTERLGEDDENTALNETQDAQIVLSDGGDDFDGKGTADDFSQTKHRASSAHLPPSLSFGKRRSTGASVTNIPRKALSFESKKGEEPEQPKETAQILNGNHGCSDSPLINTNQENQKDVKADKGLDADSLEVCRNEKDISCEDDRISSASETQRDSEQMGDESKKALLSSQVTPQDNRESNVEEMDHEQGNVHEGLEAERSDDVRKVTMQEFTGGEGNLAKVLVPDDNELTTDGLLQNVEVMKADGLTPMDSRESPPLTEWIDEGAESGVVGVMGAPENETTEEVRSLKSSAANDHESAKERDAVSKEALPLPSPSIHDSRVLNTSEEAFQEREMDNSLEGETIKSVITTQVLRNAEDADKSDVETDRDSTSKNGKNEIGYEEGKEGGITNASKLSEAEGCWNREEWEEKTIQPNNRYQQKDVGDGVKDCISLNSGSFEDGGESFTFSDTNGDSSSSCSSIHEASSSTSSSFTDYDEVSSISTIKKPVDESSSFVVHQKEQKEVGLHAETFSVPDSNGLVNPLPIQVEKPQEDAGTLLYESHIGIGDGQITSYPLETREELLDVGKHVLTILELPLRNGDNGQNVATKDEEENSILPSKLEHDTNITSDKMLLQSHDLEDHGISKIVIVDIKSSSDLNSHNDEKTFQKNNEEGVTEEEYVAKLAEGEVSFHAQDGVGKVFSNKHIGNASNLTKGKEPLEVEADEEDLEVIPNNEDDGGHVSKHVEEGAGGEDFKLQFVDRKKKLLGHVEQRARFHGRDIESDSKPTRSNGVVSIAFDIVDIHEFQESPNYGEVENPPHSILLDEGSVVDEEFEPNSSEIEDPLHIHAEEGELDAVKHIEGGAESARIEDLVIIETNEISKVEHGSSIAEVNVATGARTMDGWIESKHIEENIEQRICGTSEQHVNGQTGCESLLPFGVDAQDGLDMNVMTKSSSRDEGGMSSISFGFHDVETSMPTVKIRVLKVVDKNLLKFEGEDRLPKDTAKIPTSKVDPEGFSKNSNSQEYYQPNVESGEESGFPKSTTILLENEDEHSIPPKTIEDKNFEAAIPSMPMDSIRRIQFEDGRDNDDDDDIIPEGSFTQALHHGVMNDALERGTTEHHVLMHVEISAVDLSKSNNSNNEEDSKKNKMDLNIECGQQGGGSFQGWRRSQDSDLGAISRLSPVHLTEGVGLKSHSIGTTHNSFQLLQPSSKRSSGRTYPKDKTYMRTKMWRFCRCCCCCCIRPKVL